MLSLFFRPTRNTHTTISTRMMVIFAVMVSTAGACRSRALREWTPRDHDPDASAAPTQQTATGADDLTAARALFAAQCASCHGPDGHGDGPMAAMFRPADLSDPTIQNGRTDDELATAISRGKGRMPAFGPQLRPEAVPLLVRLIRSWRR
jgi:mono/diheme cytochrome c family protein